MRLLCTNVTGIDVLLKVARGYLSLMKYKVSAKGVQTQPQSVLTCTFFRKKLIYLYNRVADLKSDD
jgi:hypothetical protein